MASLMTWAQKQMSDLVEFEIANFVPEFLSQINTKRQEARNLKYLLKALRAAP